MCDHGKDHSCAHECLPTPDVFRYDLHQNIDKLKVNALHLCVTTTIIEHNVSFTSI